MRCECENKTCSHFDSRDIHAIARCTAEATQAILFHDRPDGQEYCLECAKDAAETLENVSFVSLEA